MPYSTWLRTLPALAVLPFLMAAAQDQPAKEKTAEEVYKNIVVFKGVPAKDLIPSMMFMCNSLKVECSFCHEASDYSADTRGKSAARHMVEMQREINTKFFNGRLQVTCNSCHNGREEPRAVPVPEGVKTRHMRVETTTKPEEVFEKHLKSAGAPPAMVTMVGTIQKESDKPAAFKLVQSPNGRFHMVGIEGTFGSDGSTMWFSGGGPGFPLVDEPAASVGRMGRSWREASDFAGLDKLTIAGKEPVGRDTMVVLRGVRKGSASTEDIYFDEKTGLLSRVVAMTKSSIGTSVSMIEYEDYKTVKGVKIPFKTVMTFNGEKRTVLIKSASVADKADDKLFEMPKS